jgi:hypothetical protein
VRQDRRADPEAQEQEAEDDTGDTVQAYPSGCAVKGVDIITSAPLLRTKRGRRYLSVPPTSGAVVGDVVI